MTRPRTGKTCVCIHCGEEYYVPPYRTKITKFCSRSCLAKAYLPKYEMFRFKKQGKPPHKYKQMKVNGKMVRVHRHLMEQHLGRKLDSSEHVHHINGDSMDNRLENLTVLSNAAHQKIEIALRHSNL